VHFSPAKKIISARFAFDLQRTSGEPFSSSAIFCRRFASLKHTAISFPQFALKGTAFPSVR
jgi:hypothetical protein